MNVNLLAASEGPFCTPEPQDEGKSAIWLENSVGRFHQHMQFNGPQNGRCHGVFFANGR